MTDETTKWSAHGASAEESQLIHDLRVHQIELEMQNQELRETQLALENVRAEYFDLYDLAPVGYCTLSAAGVVERANLTLASLLGSPQAGLIGAPFTLFILAEDQDLFYLLRRKLVVGGEPRACELRLTTRGGGFVWVRLSAVAVAAPNPEGQPSVRMTVADIGEQKQAEMALRQSLREKESLMKEIHHRVKNNLQVVSSLLRLEAGRSADLATRECLLGMQGRVLAMALLHEALYRSGVFGQVELGAYLNRLTTELFRGQSSSRAVRLVRDLAPVHVPVDQAIPCGLIVNELLTNSFKHAFTGDTPGEIAIHLRREAGQEILLRVTDTGPGLPDDFEVRKERSLGMQLVSDLARQIGGRVEVGPRPGARFDVKFHSAS